MRGPLRGRVGIPLPAGLADLAAAAGGHCAHLPELWCAEEDRRAVEALAYDVAGAGAALVPHRTKKRLQVFGEGLRQSAVLPPMLGRVLSAFGPGLSLVDCWVNVYRDGRETTGWHQDHHYLRTPDACATLNLNLGATRDLALQHIKTGREFRVPQTNGSLFAFDAGFNAAFRHSIPAARGGNPGLRLSLTVFVREGPQPTVVSRDPGNVPPGVPTSVNWEGWDLRDRGWSPGRELRPGSGEALLLSRAPLMRGHQETGRDDGVRGTRGWAPPRGSGGGGGGGSGDGGGGGGQQKRAAEGRDDAERRADPREHGTARAGERYLRAEFVAHYGEAEGARAWELAARPPPQRRGYRGARRQ